MQQVVHFGAGNIGRGFIGNLLSRSGYAVLFADVSETIIPALQGAGEYIVEEVGADRREIIVGPVSGVYSQAPELTEALAAAPLITTAVGPTVLPRIAPAIAASLRARREYGLTEPVNIVACENMVRASSALQRLVLDQCDEETREYTRDLVGFPDSAVDRIVPPMGDSSDPLRVRVEEFHEWIVDQEGFVGEIPVIEGMQLTNHLDAFVERKLFTLNTGHATAAYFGASIGYREIGPAVADARVEEVVRGAMEESGTVLVRRYGFDPIAHRRYIDKILTRFRNPYLQDDVSRVGRQPIRKLGAGERFLRPLRGTLEYGTPRDYLSVGIAAALAFRNPEDPEAAEIARTIEAQGLDAAITAYTGLGETEIERRVTAAIRVAYRMVSAGARGEGIARGA